MCVGICMCVYVWFRALAFQLTGAFTTTPPDQDLPKPHKAQKRSLWGLNIIRTELWGMLAYTSNKKLLRDTTTQLVFAQNIGSPKYCTAEFLSTNGNSYIYMHFRSFSYTFHSPPSHQNPPTLNLSPEPLQAFQSLDIQLLNFEDL